MPPEYSALKTLMVKEVGVGGVSQIRTGYYRACGICVPELEIGEDHKNSQQ